LELKLYNTLTRKKEVFKPIKDGRVGLYTCGPTVWDYAHIGNFRTFIFEDVLKRALRVFGYSIKHVMNITDVEDKTIRGSLEAKKPLREFTDFFTKEFLKDLDSLNIERANVYPRATDHITTMIGLIETLIKKGIAYKTEDGIYFSIQRFPSYGKLSGIILENLQAGARVDVDEYSKEDAKDFVLWRFKREGEPSWEAPFGEGRPGWHIECSAMAMHYLGESFDIHAGAVDLIFPHHEDEIAQSEAATGKEFARFFIEAEHLIVEGKKMSKSLGNFFTLRDLIKRGHDPLAFRYLVLSAHYRTQLNFTWESLASAERALHSLREDAARIHAGSKWILPIFLSREAKLDDAAFYRALSDDLGTPTAISVLHAVIKASYSLREKLRLIRKFDMVLGLRLLGDKKQTTPPPPEVLQLKAERDNARNAKDWAKSDVLRDKINALGWSVEDGENGSTIRKR
jgi:cysteinyl-tRNA synthetase